MSGVEDGEHAVEGYRASVAASVAVSAPLDSLARAALDALVDGVCISQVAAAGADWPGVVIYANPAFARLSPAHHDDRIGQPWAELWPEAAQLLDPGVQADLRAGRSVQQRRAGATPDDDVWFELTVRPIAENDSEGFFVTVVRDITPQQGVETRLRREHHQLRETQALAGLGTWEWDIGFDLVRWSDQLYAIFGLDPEGFQATYAAYLERVHPDDQELAAGCVRRCLQTHEPFAADYRIVLPDGAVRWLHSRGRVELDAGGHPAAMAGVCQDITDRKQLEDALLHQSLHDPLTGLPNRFLLLDRVELALSRARRENRSVAVCFIDIDHFKRVNDHAGHDAGDEVLRQVATRLRSAVRPADTVARVGGDEFVVVAEDAATVTEALAVSARLVGALRFSITTTGGNHPLTASVGVALAQPDDLPTALVFKADQAMYRAKRLGRDRSELHSPAPD